MFERTLSGALGPYFAQVKQIGAGGNGRVLSAIDTRFDFPVCIKRISVANKDECRATLREIRIRRRLRHENIVGLLNAVVSDGTDVSDITPANFRDTSCIYLVQELLDADLRQVIESYPRLSDEYVKLFFYQTLRGLKYIHSANVLHRDLKPSNIMININSLQLMIGDFGHSMVLDPDYHHGNSRTVSSTSLWYKAPELIIGTAQFSTSSDMWAAGCILAEMLLGRPLFEGENELEQLELIIHAIKVDEKDQTHVRDYLTKDANTMYSGKPKFPLQSKFQKVDIHALHLLEHLLSFNADDRVTTELALSHPFLHEYACTADEPVCLKPLHLEHEVDDFLEYTLKDLIVGECVALAEEQPQIHLQMSSYSSLTDIAKECNTSPCESSSHSMDDRLGLELKTASQDCDELSNDSEGNRFKVLEVLKEEHGSSSDSNGLTTHEEGVSEEPLVLDHPMFSSSRWENDRHRSSGHRRHHSHHRRKQSDESKSRRRKLSRDEKFHLKSPSFDLDPASDCAQTTAESLPEVQVRGDDTPGMNVLGLNCPGLEPSGTSDVEVTSASNSRPMKEQDDKVHELIMRSRQLIADQTVIMNDVPAITDICCSTKQSVEVPMETEDAKPKDSTLVKNFISLSAGDLSMLNHRKPVVDLGVTEVIRRSRELLGQLHSPNASDEKRVATDKNDCVQDLVTRSEQLLKSTQVQSSTTPEHNSCATEERHSFASDYVKDLISKSAELCKSNQITERLRTVNTSRNSGVKVENCSPESTLEDRSYNYTPPFTENSADLKTELPPADQLLSFNPSATVHSSVKDNVCTPWVDPPNHLRPATDNTLNSLETALSDPYNLKESNRRMQELFDESHSLLKNLRADEINEGDFENSEEVPQTKPVRTETFNERLDEINSEEIKTVLDQAKKLLDECNDSDSSNVKQSPSVCPAVNDMEVDSEEKFAAMEIDSMVNVETVQDDLKHLSRFQSQLDFVHVAPGGAIEQAAIYEVIKVERSPSIEKEISRVNSLAQSRDSAVSTKIEVLDELGEYMGQRNGAVDGLQLDNEVFVKKRSNDTLCETADDSSHKHFKNSGLIIKDVSLSKEDVNDAVAENIPKETGVLSRNHCQEYANKDMRLNGMKTCTLDLNVDKRLIGSNGRADFVLSKNCHIKCETLDKDRVIEEMNSDDVVNKLYRSTCRMESNTKRLNSKDSVRLQNFYAALKIKSIMRNRSRPCREKRYDTYPF